MGCCFNFADGHSSLVTRMLTFQGKTRNNKERAMNSLFLWAQSDNEIMVFSILSNQTYRLIVLRELSHVTQPLAVSISWQLSAQHTIEGQKATQPPNIGQPQHVASSAPPCLTRAELCFPRGTLTVNRETMAAVQLGGIHLCGKFRFAATES